jgi:hypothetical protein
MVVEQDRSVVKQFSQPVLSALTGLAAANRMDPAAPEGIDDLLDASFRDVQDVVATIAHMRDAVGRANEGLRDVGADDARAAA